MFGRKKDETKENEDQKVTDIDKDKLSEVDRTREKKKRKHRDKEDTELEGGGLEGETKKKKRKHKDKDKEIENEPQKKEVSPSPSKTVKPPPDVSKPYQLSEPDKASDEFSEDDKFGDSFKDSRIRTKFIRKVYLILSIQLGFTACFNIPFLYLDDVQEFIDDYPWIVFVSLVVFVVPYFMLVCCESTRRNFPTNIILLLLMTLGMAGVCGFVTGKLDTEVVFYAFLLTVVVTLTITTIAIFCPELFSCINNIPNTAIDVTMYTVIERLIRKEVACCWLEGLTQFDFTSCLMVLCVVVIVLIVFAMFAVAIIIYTQSRIVNLVYAGICVVLFSLFLMFDTQAIIGGRRVRLSPEEYILAAIQIYVDIVEIFLNFLELIGACTEND